MNGYSLSLFGGNGRLTIKMARSTSIPITIPDFNRIFTYETVEVSE
jgi:hypothetical protein